MIDLFNGCPRQDVEAKRPWMGSQRPIKRTVIEALTETADTLAWPRDTST